MKEKGILLPIFSLPSKYGIGDFGYEAYQFIDILSENNILYWEILPINACLKSPYSPISYYALEPSYISLDKLKDDGLITEAEIREDTNKVIYDNFKEKYYKEAFSNFKKDEKYEDFIKNKEINEYADFIKDTNGEDKEYTLFLQYILYKQWMELKNYANSKNVKIMGDIPMYPIFNSVETAYYPEYFQMENGKFTFESGTPPDYFNSNGQKWNSPVYNVENIKKDNCNYLIKRFKYQLGLFDKLRIDHFRGYDSFYKIPIGKSGKDGIYEDGVSYAFFDELLKDKSIKIDDLIIEDLGDIRKETIALREHYNFTRQKILQFTINLNKIIPVDTDNNSENAIVFPGTHDCPTIYEWYESLDNKYKKRLHRFLKRNKCSDSDINIAIIHYLMKCKAKIVIIMAQDILGLDKNARLNIPGTTSDNNWSWKLTDFEDFKEKIKKFN